jgi:hypothetical protein
MALELVRLKRAIGALERLLRVVLDGHAIASEFQAGIKEEDEVIHESN